MNTYRIQHWLDLNVGELSDESKAHGKAVMFVSVLMILVEPAVTVTFGQASFIGIGISVNPPITIPVGNLLLALLAYRYVSFWVTTILDNGTNHKKSERKAAYNLDPDYGAEHPPQDTHQLVSEVAYATTFKWRVWKIIWAFMLPNIFALMALFKYGLSYVGSGSSII